jgi:hypothetical protein
LFENRVLKRMFGPRGKEVKGRHTEDYNNAYFSLNIITVMKSRRMR